MSSPVPPKAVQSHFNWKRPQEATRDTVPEIEPPKECSGHRWRHIDTVNITIVDEALNQNDKGHIDRFFCELCLEIRSIQT